MLRSKVAWLSLLLTVGAFALGCKSPSKPAAEKTAPETQPSAPVVDSLTLGGYTTPREAYGKAILPAFLASWREGGKRDAKISESYLASGAQARAILGGFEADVAALSLEPDIEKLTKGGLITQNWKAGEYGGMVTRSVVVIGVRPGNPKKIASWQDLAKPGVAVLTPNVRTSGGAMWNVLAIYGAILRGHAGVKADDEAAAIELLAKILKNVKVMDSGARDSMLNFERGVGDAIITYENEILVSRLEGKAHEYVTPESTILIENPVAIVDKNVEKHKNSEVAAAFVKFLYSPEAQRSFAKYGLRPVVPSIATEFESTFGKVSDLFTVRDLGDWAVVTKKVFAEGGAYEKALKLSQEKK
jgi:sulfate/thiosulfate transport system substrate-binding protein